MAEIGHAVVYDETHQSTSSASFVTPTGWEITGASLDGSSNYILICSCNFGGDNTAVNTYEAQIQENGVGLLTGSGMRTEPRGSGDSFNEHFGYVKKVTTPSTPNDYEFQIKGDGTNTADAMALHMLMLKLDDITENTDWFYAEDATADDNLLAASWTDRDSVTIGDGSSTYLVIGHAQFESDSTADEIRVIIDVGGVEYGEYQNEVEDSVQVLPCMVTAIVSAPAASTVAKVKVRAGGAATPDCIHSSIFVLRLDAFEDFFASIDSSMSQTQISATGTVYTASTKTHTTSTGATRNWLLGATGRWNVQGDAFKSPEFHILDSGNSIDLGGVAAWPDISNATWVPNGTSAIPSVTRFNDYSLANNTSLDMDARTLDKFDAAPTYGMFDVTWFGFSFELAATATTYNQSVGGALTPTSLLTDQITFTKAAAGTFTPAGAMSRLTGKGVSAALTPSALQSRSTLKNVDGSVSPASVLAIGLSLSRIVAGSLAPVGGIIRRINKAVSGTLGPLSSQTKDISKGVVGSISPAGNPTRRTSKGIAGGTTPSGDTAAGITTTQTTAGSVTPAGGLVKRTYKTLLAALLPSGGTTKQTGKTVSGEVAPESNIIRDTSKSVSGEMTPDGDTSGSVRLKTTIAGILAPISGALATLKVAPPIITGTALKLRRLMGNMFNRRQ